MHAKAGKEKEVEQFLKSTVSLAEQEPGTTAHYVFSLGPARFGVFGTFKDENGRNAHRAGKIYDAAFARMDLVDPLSHRENIEILGAKDVCLTA